jgi:hypothetical protein
LVEDIAIIKSGAFLDSRPKGTKGHEAHKPPPPAREPKAHKPPIKLIGMKGRQHQKPRFARLKGQQLKGQQQGQTPQGKQKYP